MRYRPVPPEEDDWEQGGFVSDAAPRDYDLEGGFVSEDEELYAAEQDAFSESAAAERHDEALRARRSRKNKRQRRKLTTVLLILIALVLGELLFLYGRWARPPEVNDSISEQTAGEDAPFAHIAGRRDGCYTFLIAGKDKVAGLTDTILVGMMDTKAHTLRFVSIPRDTAVNVPWSPKKINQIYPSAEAAGQSGVEAMISGVEKLIGYRVDCYAIFDVDVFIELVDTMGGVYFDVPVDMNYDDPGQDLYIHVSKGYQKLNGYDTMCVFRFRHTYVNGDIGRLDVQHALLKSVASQMLSLGNIPNLRKLVDIVEKNVITNLSAGNIMFFVQEFLKMNEDDIVFDTAPGNYGGEMNGLSYVFLYLDEWLTYVNDYLNPFNDAITVDNLDIIYNAPNGAVTATTGSIRGSDRW